MSKVFYQLLFLLALLVKGTTWATTITVPGSLTHESKVSLKQVIEGSIPIQNESDQIATVKVTLSDYLFKANGESSFPQAGTCSRSNSSWIKSGSKEIEVAPHTTYNFSYKVEIPNDTSLKGSYWSIFLIEPIEEKFADATKEKSLGVQTIIRYGVQVITHVGEKGSYELKVLDKKITKDNENTSLSLSVENTGSLMQTPSLLLELVDEKGKKAGRFEIFKQRILPSCSVTYQVDLSTIPQGKYKAMAILDHGEGAFFGAQYDIELN